MTPQDFLLELNAHPMAGDAIVWRHRGDFLGAAIRFAQRGQWEHVSCPISEWAMIEAHWPGGVKQNSTSVRGEWAYLRLKNHGRFVKDHERLPQKSFEKRYWAMLRQARNENWPYDLKAIFGALFNLPRWQSSNPKAVICSELLAVCLEHAGLNLWARRAHRPWPQTVFECSEYDVLGGYLGGRFIGGLNLRPEDKAEFLKLL